MSIAEHLAENSRLVGNLIKKDAEVIALNPSAGKMRLKVDENETDWVDIPLIACGTLKIWRCPSLGELFTIICESGNLGNAVAVIAQASDENPYPSNDPNLLYIDFGTGTFSLNMAEGSAVFSAKSLIFDVPETQFNGTVHANKDISSDTDVLAKSISLLEHKHIGVRSGGDVSGAPQ